MRALLDAREHAGQLIAHAGQEVEQAALIVRAHGDPGGQVAIGDAICNGSGVARFATEFACQATCRDPGQRGGGKEAGHEQYRHHGLGGDLRCGHAGNRVRSLLIQRGPCLFDQAGELLQLFADEVSVDRDR